MLARYAAGADASALELIKREWGFMAQRGPGTMWETIANETGAQVDSSPSLDHGWSSGAAPALTNYVLGVQPTSPGFATFTVTPHPSGLTSASGVVPTPRGPIRVSWSTTSGEALAPGHGAERNPVDEPAASRLRLDLCLRSGRAAGLGAGVATATTSAAFREPPSASSWPSGPAPPGAPPAAGSAARVAAPRSLTHLSTFRWAAIV